MKRLSGLTCFTFDGGPWRGVVIASLRVSRASLYQPAGKRSGLDDERWIWPDITRIIREVSPRLVWLENVPGLVSTGGFACCLEDLPRSGSMRNGECWQRPTLEPVTDVSDCSFWPTADTNPDGRNNRSASPNAAMQPTLAYAVKQWLTPHGMSGRTRPARSVRGRIPAGRTVGNADGSGRRAQGHCCVEDRIDPAGNEMGNAQGDGWRQGRPELQGVEGDPIPGQAASWPTPAASLAARTPRNT